MISAPGEPPGSRVSTTSMPMLAQRVSEQADLGRLAGALAAFERDEPSAHRLRSRSLAPAVSSAAS